MRQKLTFLARFVVVLVALYVTIAINPVNDSVIVPFTAGVTAISGAVVRIFQKDVTVTGTVIASPRFAMDVKNGCNAVETMMLFIAAVIAFPAPALFRLAGLALGLPLIQAINIVRLISLFWVGIHRRDLFDIFHIALWQTAIILIGVGTFAVWSSIVARRSADRR